MDSKSNFGFMAGHWPLLRQFIKFSIVGVLNTVVDFGAYAFFTRVAGLHFLVANSLSFTLAVTISFFINRKWTFRASGQRLQRQYAKFFLINLVSLGLTSLLLVTMIHWLRIHDLLAKAIAVCLVLFWNFFANRAWTFKAVAGSPILPDGPKHDILGW